MLRTTILLKMQISQLSRRDNFLEKYLSMLLRYAILLEKISQQNVKTCYPIGNNISAYHQEDLLASWKKYLRILLRPATFLEKDISAYS